MAISIKVDTTVVHKMMSLNDGKIPAHLKTRDAVRTGEEFDPNSYFSVLTHLSMKPGYTLDYIYDYRKGFSGSPHLYARKLRGQVFCLDIYRNSGDTLLNSIARKS